MNYNYDLYRSLEDSMGGLWGGTTTYVPQIILAILVLILGWIIGNILGSAVRKVLHKVRVDELLDKAGVDTLSEKAGVAFKPTRFIGALVKWVIILAFLVVSFDILGLQEVTTFMREVVLGYLPQVIAAVLILFAAVIIGSVAGTSLTAALRASGTGNPEVFGKAARYLVIIFGVMAALKQLSIAGELIETLFMGIVFALSLAFGLAFGLGGKEAASRYIDRVTGK